MRLPFSLVHSSHGSPHFLSYTLFKVGGDCIYEPALAARFKERYPERRNLAEGA